MKYRADSITNSEKMSSPIYRRCLVAERCWVVCIEHLAGMLCALMARRNHSGGGPDVVRPSLSPHTPAVRREPMVGSLLPPVLLPRKNLAGQHPLLPACPAKRR